jgi:hypothetical protein
MGTMSLHLKLIIGETIQVSVCFISGTSIDVFLTFFFLNFSQRTDLQNYKGDVSGVMVDYIVRTR